MPLDKAGPGVPGGGEGVFLGGRRRPAVFWHPGPQAAMPQRPSSRRRRPHASELVAKPLPGSRGVQPGSAGGLTSELS